MITQLFAVALGGAMGAGLRGLFLRLERPRDLLGWPPRGPAVATLLANTLGCALLGLWTTQGRLALERAGLDWTVLLELAVTAGFCGGLSTFSSLCADVLRLARNYGPAVPALYLATTIVSGLAAYWLATQSAPA